MLTIPTDVQNLLFNENLVLGNSCMAETFAKEFMDIEAVVKPRVVAETCHRPLDQQFPN
jgi:hypothetical protein